MHDHYMVPWLLLLSHSRGDLSSNPLVSWRLSVWSLLSLHALPAPMWFPPTTFHSLITESKLAIGTDVV